MTTLMKMSCAYLVRTVARQTQIFRGDVHIQRALQVFHFVQGEARPQQVPQIKALAIAQLHQSEAQLTQGTSTGEIQCTEVELSGGLGDVLNRGGGVNKLGAVECTAGGDVSGGSLVQTGGGVVTG